MGLIGVLKLAFLGSLVAYAAVSAVLVMMLPTRV